MRHRTLPPLALALGVALTACGTAEPKPLVTESPEPPTPSASATAAAPPTALLPTGDPEVVAADLDTPWSVAFLDETALVSDRDDGDVLELLPNGGTRVIGTVAGVVHDGESGLLGLAVDDQDRLYAYSTGSDGNRIERYTLTGAPGSLALGARETLLVGIPAASNHDGGRLGIGPDGMLYATTGDAGDRDDAQDLDSLGGKILRMTLDGAVPADNPFPGSLVYSYGHRNPQGLAWAADGTMFAAEFGQDTWDELNVITPGGNYGWPEVEGIEGDGDYIDPVQQWNPDDASPSGIAIAEGTVYIANLRGAVLRAVPVADPGESTEYYAGEYGRLRAVTAAPDGRLWFATSNTDGRGDPADDDDRIFAVTLG
ncbi:Glucose/arabinose dehydrogenase, beta-propeller fold [Glycomyces sambucus]|uniref:Glucose/arabinose dehydrogenase, beta-propeller fold n=1 Tax=Glycomyces sambucus TaxID=380244 RepID=A0A1G9FKL2_9ACTN|nr:PQQ-dependent sugar dehydrogenase [Glycomyces sambucus]SDK88924.1 Glucose/arabinose dehydrogenase, beta-propeller fold [Glycomyces sambucus]